MDDELVLKFEARVPRYTSYPTPPHFDPAVDARQYRRWLEALDPGITLSLYLHVPFCTSLCWFCGCQTTVVNRYQPVAAYIELLKKEIDAVAEVLGPGRSLSHLHWGGGTPTIVSGDDFRDLMAQLRRCFDFAADAEIAVEADPRALSLKMAAALAAAGVTRASLGVQDVNLEVQRVINRVQPRETTARAVAWLRQAGISDINLDLMYGLPRQTVPGIIETVDSALGLRPDRLCLFGYAHVPWMRPHQRLIDESSLPDAKARLKLYRAASGRLVERGYVAIGLDHFARPDDSMARAAAEGRLHRNFQGYTTDDAGALIGIGASAIGTLPQGYVQNAARVPEYRKAIKADGLATVRGLAIDDGDRLRREVIERLMCALDVDLAEVGARFRVSPEVFRDSLAALEPLESDGLITILGDRVTVRPEGRPVVRVVCAAFDRYLADSKARHSPAI